MTICQTLSNSDSNIPWWNNSIQFFWWWFREFYWIRIWIHHFGRNWRTKWLHIIILHTWSGSVLPWRANIFIQTLWNINNHRVTLIKFQQVCNIRWSCHKHSNSRSVDFQPKCWFGCDQEIWKEKFWYYFLICYFSLPNTGLNFSHCMYSLTTWFYSQEPYVYII